MRQPRAYDAVEAAQAAYETSTHSHAESEGLLVPPMFAVRGTTFDRGRILTGDALLDGLITPWRPRDYPELGWCHKGFLRGKGFGRYRGALGLWQTCYADLFSTGPLIITGHSKGAAEAAIIAACMVLARRPVKALITFGMPRVTVTGHLAALLADIPQFHYVHGRDIVPRVPVAPWWKRWGHQIHLPGSDDGGPFTDHRLAAYQRAVLNLHA